MGGRNKKKSKWGLIFFAKFIILKGPFLHCLISFKFSNIVRWCVVAEILSCDLCGWLTRKRQPLSNCEQKGTVNRDLPMTETVIINSNFFANEKCIKTRRGCKIFIKCTTLHNIFCGKSQPCQRTLQLTDALSPFFSPCYFPELKRIRTNWLA